MRCFRCFCISFVFILFFACSSSENSSDSSSLNPSSSNETERNEKCNVVFYANGGKMGEVYSKSFAYEKNELITLPTSDEFSLERYGHRFLGWSQNSYMNEAEYSAGQNYTVLVNTMFYAIWKAYSEFGFTVSITDLSDIKVEIMENEESITFTPEIGFTSYIWKIDNTEISQNYMNREYKCMKSDLSKGIHNIVLEAQKDNFWYSFSAQITVE